MATLGRPPGARQTQAADELSPAARAVLARLGQDVWAAIKVREIYQAFAKRVGVNRTTLRKLVNGEPGASLGTLAVLDTLDILDHLDEVAAPEKDSLGQAQLDDSLWRRV